jgi:hypothetical protein
MYKSIQTQLSKINEQLNFIFVTISNNICDNFTTNEKISAMSEDINDIISSLLQITNDSETILTTTKESEYNEKND